MYANVTRLVRGDVTSLGTVTRVAGHWAEIGERVYYQQFIRAGLVRLVATPWTHDDVFTSLLGLNPVRTQSESENEESCGSDLTSAKTRCMVR